ncbi:hypothetical protein PFISCL1PPCAC_2363 [Pristionchus fissidentatus]|uniref:Mitochondrial basic amino acids transporter n=1 Tax=Pristionchus fissidentatus TaxID=1538716 RepID=A0AAV5UVE2_9BILA|nr:hypothetical protein PFISCL1PPCAC_2363 [Pristionchus fissidentatus]
MALDFFAGCVGGAAGVLAGHPLDTVKVRLQTQEVGSKLYKGTWHCFATIVRQEKICGLYKGITPPLTSLAIINATVFGVHGSIARRFVDPDSTAAHFAAGSAAGLCQSIIATPSERVKLLIQIQNDSAHAPRYTSCRHAAMSLWKREGIKGMTRGYWATVLRDCPAFGIYFASYDWMAKKMSKDGKMESLTCMQLLTAGGGAGMLSWLFNYPTDVIKTRFQTCTSYKSYRECLMKALADGGWRSLFVGLNSTLIRAFPSNAATFFTVEMTYRLLMDFNLLKIATQESSSKQNNKNHVMMSDLWHKNWFILPEAGSTSIDPMLRHRHHFS